MKCLVCDKEYIHDGYEELNLYSHYFWQHFRQNQELSRNIMWFQLKDRISTNGSEMFG